MEDGWLAWAKRLEALARTGAHFTRDPFDAERYEEIAGIARAMMGRLADAPPAAIAGLFDAQARGYATPQIDVRAAVIREGRILMVRERTDGLWTLPGGYADVGASPAENAVREVWEEAGVTVRALRPYAIRHKARHPYAQDLREFYKIHVLCAEAGGETPAPGPETLEAAFVAPDALPPLSLGRTIEADVAEALAAHADPARPVAFD